jgi:AcrR family transcriptional regulator
MASDSERTDTAGEFEPRRLPMQARSRKRVNRILDAAAQLLIEEGYGGVKTNHIAKRAEVSIGSIYQFFPNRYAIFHSLAIRYMDRIRKIMEGRLGPDAPVRPWAEALDDVIDTLAELWKSEPAFLAVWMAIQNTPELRAEDKYYSQIFVDDILAAFLERNLVEMPDARRGIVARVIFEISQVLLDHSIIHGGDEQPIVIEELKTVLRSYIQAHIDANAPVSAAEDMAPRD